MNCDDSLLIWMNKHGYVNDWEYNPTKGDCVKIISDWTTCLGDLIIYKPLGRGSYGHVFKVGKRDQQYAAKIVSIVDTKSDLFDEDSTSMSQFNKEVRISKLMGDHGLAPKIDRVIKCPMGTGQHKEVHTGI